MSDLPDGWVAAPLRDLVSVNPKHDPDTDRTTQVSFVPMPAVDEHEGAITEPQVRLLSEVWKGFTHFAEGDVIFAKITPCMENGKTAIARDLMNGLACGSTEFHVLRPTDAVSADFLWRFLRQQSYRADAEAAMTGAVGQRRVPKAFLEETVLPTPPIAEQRRIGAQLDRLSTRTKAVRAHLARVQSLATRAKQAITRQLIRERTWETASFLDVCEAYQPRTISKAQMKPDGQFPVFGANGKIGLFDEFNHEHPELLVTCRGATCGAVNVSEPFSWINGNAMVIKGKSDGYILDFLKAYFSHGFDFSDVISGSAQPQITRQSLAKLQMPIVPIDEQQTIVRRIEAAFARIDRMVENGTRAAHLLDRLDQRLLAKAFRGELVPQDPNDEPAAELLARIEAARAAAPNPKRGRRQRA